MSFEGTIKAWVAGKGFGFITKQDGSGDVFVHFRQIKDGRKTLNIGEKVTYTLGTNPKTGRPVVENVVGDGTGTPMPEGGQVGFGGRGGLGGRDGSAGRGGVKSCFGFQKGQCNFGDNCRFSHEGNSGVQGMRGGRGGPVYDGGRGMRGQGSDQPQARFSPYGAQGGARNGQNVRGGYTSQSYANQGPHTMVLPAQGGGGYGEQSIGGYASQGVGAGGHNRQTGLSSQEGMMNSSYQQLGGAGFPSIQSADDATHSSYN